LNTKKLKRTAWLSWRWNIEVEIESSSERCMLTSSLHLNTRLRSHCSSAHLYFFNLKQYRKLLLLYVCYFLKPINATQQPSQLLTPTQSNSNAILIA
jgi:hypothetical protein